MIGKVTDNLNLESDTGYSGADINPAICVWNGTNWLPVDGSGTAAF